MSSHLPSPSSQPALRRSLGLPTLLLYGLGTTIGAGIYALTGAVAGAAGLLAPAAFLFAAALAFFTALSFCELSSRFPRAGGEAVYVSEGIRWSWLTMAVGLLTIFAGLVSAATVSVGFVGYLSEFLAVPRLVTIAGIVLVIGAVAAWGVRESVVLAAIMTVIEIGGLLAVIAFGADHLAEAATRVGELVPRDLGGVGAMAGAALICFYAFLGFEDMVNVAEEVRDVRRTLPRAILLTLGVTALLYVLLTSVAVLAVPPDELAAADAPLSLVFERCGGPPAVLGVIALFALLNGALIQVIKSSRILYGLAGQGALPAQLSRVHPRTQTPLLATAVATLVTGMFALTLPLAVLAETTSVITLATFALTNLSLVLVKRRGPAPADAFETPIAVPVVGFVLSAGFVLIELGRRIPG